MTSRALGMAGRDAGITHYTPLGAAQGSYSSSGSGIRTNEGRIISPLSISHTWLIFLLMEKTSQFLSHFCHSTFHLQLQGSAPFPPLISVQFQGPCPSPAPGTGPGHAASPGSPCGKLTQEQPFFLWQHKGNQMDSP